MSKHLVQRWYSLVIAGLLAMPLGSTSADTLFEQYEPLEITLSGPFLKMRKERDKAASYPGTLTAEGLAFNVEFSVRGNKRLDKSVCRNPPLWVDFDKQAIKKTLFHQQKNLKLVVLCNDRAVYQDYLRSEYIAYRLFNIATDNSYRVRWLRVRFTDEKGDIRNAPGFFIERKARLAKRVGLEKVDVDRIKPLELAPDAAALASLFQYVISNMDYSLVMSADDDCCHNAKLLLAEDGHYVPVIYDFDSSGLVNAKYALPPDNLKIQKVTSRVFRGYCLHNDALRRARGRLLGVEDQMIAVIEDDPVLSRKGIKRLTKFLKKSFEHLNDDQNFQKKIVDDCRG